MGLRLYIQSGFVITLNRKPVDSVILTMYMSSGDCFCRSFLFFLGGDNFTTSEDGNFLICFLENGHLNFGVAKPKAAVCWWRQVRKGTGFVSSGELPPSDDEAGPVSWLKVAWLFRYPVPAILRFVVFLCNRPFFDWKKLFGQKSGCLMLLRKVPQMNTEHRTSLH